MMSDPGKNRTCNPQLRRLLLYPVELRDQNLNIGILNMAAAHKERSQAMFELRDPKSLFLEITLSEIQTRYPVTNQSQGIDTIWTVDRGR